MNYFIWWLSQQDCELIEASSIEVPEGYLRDEFESRLGRAGRGRLWINHQVFPTFPTNIEYDEAATQMLATLSQGDYGGIVIREEDLPECMKFPGFITDARIRPV